MATHQDLIDLATRCERATGPDRELGFEILLACGWRKTCVGHFHGPLFQWSDGGKLSYAEDKLPCPTGSIDAAMTLRPAGWSYQLKTAEHHENGFQFECWVSWGPTAYRRISAQATTEARAISAGWLRARDAPSRAGDGA